MRALAAVAVLAALPQPGLLVPGRSLGGIRLGEPAAQVRAPLGSFHGVCRGCSRTTWYFTYRRFDRVGLGVELERGRVAAVYTLWQPAGWRTPSGVALGAPEAALPAALLRVECSGYAALVHRGRDAQTAYYVVNGKLWGFGLLRPRDSPCR